MSFLGALDGKMPKTRMLRGRVRPGEAMLGRDCLSWLLMAHKQILRHPCPTCERRSGEGKAANTLKIFEDRRYDYKERMTCFPSSLCIEATSQLFTAPSL